VEFEINREIPLKELDLVIMFVRMLEFEEER
jgi:hypothetical protein